MKKMPTEKFMNLGDYKKQAILDAMRAEFMITPYSEIRISSLIKRAGISRASFYLYFQSKEDLFTCMMYQLRERLEQGLVDAFQEKQSSFNESMDRLVNRIMEDEIYRDCWTFCKRVMEDGTCREVAACAEREFDKMDLREKPAKKCYEAMDRSGYPRLNEEKLRYAIGMGMLVIVRISMLYLDHTADPKMLKEMASQQFAILDRGIRD